MTYKEKLLNRAKKVLVGGVNSPIRALTRPEQLLAVKGKGPYIYDESLGKLVDYVLGYGPLILGHAHPEVKKAIIESIEHGWLYGATSPLEISLAEKILTHVYPGGKIRFVNSGTEATMLALRLARAYTGRNLIVKFDGCYHGAHDYLLVSAGSAAGHLGVPKSPGIPSEVSRLTLIAEYNDPGGLEEIFSKYGDQIAGVIVEPVIGNYGVISPSKGFLLKLRKLTEKYGTVLIFDEVITGFRLSLGGAQEYFGIRADLVTLGKIIGGGLPIGAVAGRREIMDLITPVGKVFNAGTFNGHPLAMAAGLATIRVLEKEGLGRAVDHARALEDIIRESLDSAGITYSVNRIGPMMQFYLGVENVEKPSDIPPQSKDLYTRIHEEMTRHGVLIAPSQLEALFTSIVHGDNEAELFHQAYSNAVRRVLKG
ncbi:MAG: glutamate-1-semialdehyde 2,1-aminomutase [Desulfurococcales archaeon]|nr:glutamate-1-semialdehyde 2,1-aminomutase [Desulfurococcales archaeon]